MAVASVSLPQLDDPEALAAADGGSLPAAQANAKRKQYDVNLIIKITETGNPSTPYFDNDYKYTGVSYGVMVAIEHGLLQLVQKLLRVGDAVAIGEVPPAQP